jgi:hypothetical protein
LSTTSRYLNITKDGMHGALERFEAPRKEEERRTRGKRVAKSAAATNQGKSGEPTKSVQ